MIYVLSDAGVTQLVECNLAKVDVAGSNPVSRSILTVEQIRAKARIAKWRLPCSLSCCSLFSSFYAGR
jgi:hypothetical protein